MASPARPPLTAVLPTNKEASPAVAVSEASPLKAAANLIQTLDIAHTEMTGFAADAARDAESARRNARAAQEIARRYQNRSYPKVKSSFDDITMTGLSEKRTFTPASTGTTSIGAPSSITPRPKPPKIKNYYGRDHGKEPDRNENEILDIAAELKTPPRAGATASKPTPPRTYENGTTTNNKNEESQGARMPPSYRKNRDFSTPSSVERIAQHHAEDVLKLSLELERTKQALKSEQRMHEECKTSLASMRSKTSALEEQNQKLLEDLEKERKQSTQEVSNLKQELENGRLRLQAAEEDAQLALDIAKDSAEQRDQMEDELQMALKEIEELKAKNKTNGDKQEFVAETPTPKRHVRFADSENQGAQQQEETKTPESVFATPMSSASGVLSRSLVASGRQVLRRELAASPEDVVVRLELTPAKSAERRQRLRQRLTELDDLIVASSSPSRGTPINSPLRLPAGTTGTNGENENAAIKKKLEECHAAAKILQTSGKRLDLDGYWWRSTNSVAGKTPLPHPIQLDVMARQYCQNVEFKIDRQQKEINELESLCGYLEKKLVLDEN